MAKRLVKRGVDFRISCLLCLFIVNYLHRFTNIVAPIRLSCTLNGKKAFYSIVSCSDAYFTPHGELPLQQVKSIPGECQPALPTGARIGGISQGGHHPWPHRKFANRCLRLTLEITRRPLTAPFCDGRNSGRVN